MARAKSLYGRRTNYRPVARVSTMLEKQIGAYIVAASSTAVALVGGPTASAEVVYTPTHVVVNSGLEGGTSYPIDINNDGTPDFSLYFTRFASHGLDMLLQFDVVGNQVRYPVGGSFSAAALKKNAPIGPEQKFTAKSFSGGGGALMAASYYYHTVDQFGPWVGATNRYLGLKFMIGGKVHYGWARLTLNSLSGSNIQVTLNGYAYETEAKRKILAGQESSNTQEERSTADISSLQLPAQKQPSLGLLALGFDGLDA